MQNGRRHASQANLGWKTPAESNAATALQHTENYKSMVQIQEYTLTFKSFSPSSYRRTSCSNL